MGVPATVLNSTQFLDRISRPATDRHRVVIGPGSLILVDEASMLPTGHAAAIKRLAARTGSKEIFAGDQQQLQAVEEGGAMGLQARKHGYLQLAEPVRFTLPWERDATLRLRSGDTAVADEYDQQGRVIGGSREEVLEGAAQMAVTLLASNTDVVLMARAHEHVRELARRVRDELTRLGVVDSGRTVPLAEGARAGVHDLVVNRVNDHQAGLANGDVVRIEAIEDDGRVRIRKATGRDPRTGEPVFVRAIGYASLKNFDSAYARTAHTAQGGQGEAGIAVVTGNENRQWLYPAMTRGTDANYAWVMTTSPSKSDPQARPRSAPELARAGRVDRIREGLPPEAEGGKTPDRREAADVLADVIGRDGTELSATEFRERQLANADHLGLLEAMWHDALAGPHTDRYRQLLAETVPEAYAAGAADSPKATWLWRSLRAADAGGLDAREVLQTAADSRPLAGAQDVAAVLDARIRPRVACLTPLPEGRFSDQVPQVATPPSRNISPSSPPRWTAGLSGSARSSPSSSRNGWSPRSATCRRKRRPGPGGSAPPGTSRSTGSGTGTTRASRSAPNRPRLPRRSEPPGTPPPRPWACRRTGLICGTGTPACCGSCVTPTARRRPGRPRFVRPELRAVRTGAREAELTRARAAAEARAAESRGDADAAVRQHALARSSAGLRDWYTTREAELAEADQDYQQWSHATEAARRQAVAADAELRRRDPGRVPGPLRSAEPQPVTEAERAEIDPILIRAHGAAADSPGWVKALAEGRPAFREQLAERHSIRIPDPDPEYADHGPAWPMIEPGSRDAIMQRPDPELPAAPGLAPEPEPEAGA